MKSETSVEYQLIHKRKSNATNYLPLVGHLEA